MRELVLLVDAKGYTPQDAPILSVWVGHTLESVDHCLAHDKQSGAGAAHHVGEWAVDIEGYHLSCFVLFSVFAFYLRYPPCSTLIFTFPEPRECQIVAIKFSLPVDILEIPSLATPKSRSHSRTPSPPTAQSIPTSSFSSVPHLVPSQTTALVNSSKMTITPELQMPHSDESMPSRSSSIHSTSSTLSTPPSYSDRFLPTLQPDNQLPYLSKVPQLHIGRIRIHGTFPVASLSPSFPLSFFRSTFPPLAPPRSPATISRNPAFRSNPTSTNYPPPDSWKLISPTSDIYPPSLFMLVDYEMVERP